MKDYNFFSAFEKKKLAVDPKSPTFIIAAALIVALIFCGGVALGNLFLNQRLNDVNLALNEKKASPDYIEVQKVQEELSALDQYEKLTDQVSADYRRATIFDSGLFGEIAGLMPQNVRMNSLVITGNAVNLQCSSADKKAFAQLLTAMNGSGLFVANQLVSVSALLDQNNGVTSNIAVIQAVLKAGDDK